MVTAVVPGAKVQAESALEPAVREAPETPFDVVVARAVAKSKAHVARKSCAEEPDEAESGDASLCAYVAALVSQSPAIPLPHQAEEAAGDAVLGASAQGGVTIPAVLSAAQGGATIPAAMPAAQGDSAVPLAAAMAASKRMPRTQVVSGAPNEQDAPTAPRPGAQAFATQIDGEPAQLAPPVNAQAEQTAQPSAQPSHAGQAVLMNPQARQMAQAASAATSVTIQRPGEHAASDAGSTSAKPDASAPNPILAAGPNAAGQAGTGASAAGRSDRYAQVQAQAEKAVHAGKSAPSERVSDAESAPRPVEERRGPQEPVLPAQRGVAPLLRADRPAEAQHPEAAHAPRDADTAAQLFRATTSALSRGESSYRLKLRPEGLGEVTVAISAKDRELHLTIRAQSESTREIILNQIGALKLELASSDYHLSGFSVDVSGGGAGGEAFAAFQDGQERRSPGGRHPEPRATPLADASQRIAPEMRAGAINLRA